MRINIGCNDLKLEGFINIDIDPRVNPDMVADCLHLPFEDGSIEEIYAGHLLEHTTPQEKALEEWARVLKPYGKITITVPDIEKALWLYGENKIDLKLLNQVAFGADDRDEQNHHQLFTRDIILMQMKPYFSAKLVADSDYAFFKVEWQTIVEGYKTK